MNAFTYSHRMAARFMAVLAVFSLLTSMVPMQAFAGKPLEPKDGDLNPQVDICHATKASSNPYSDGKQLVDANSIVYGNNAHDAHDNGGLDNLGDIIEPFVYGDPLDPTPYPGQNWTHVFSNGLTGQEIAEKGCDTKSINLSVTKAADDETPNEGQTVVYTIVVSNAGPDTATNVVLADTIPAGTTFVSATPVPTGTTPYIWNLGSILSGGSKTVTVTVTVDADTRGDVITNRAIVKADETDSTPRDNTVTEDITVNTPVELCTNPDATNNGQPLPCVFTTTGTIVVDKVTVPSADSQSFAFTTTGTGYNGFNLTDAAVANSQTVEAGSYSVAETAVAGWTQTSVACVSSIQDVEVASALELDANETITCTFTNTKDVPPGNGTIIVDKVTVPAADAQSFTFTTTGDGFTGFNLADESVANAQVLVAGSYSVAETAVAGWTQTSVACVSSIQDVEVASALELDANETITCTFTNTKDVPEEPVCEVGENLLSNGSFEEPTIDGDWSLVTAADWVVGKVSDASTVLGEIWANGFMGGASDGDQHVELDSTEPTVMSQAVTTVDGATYELRFDYRSRPDTEAGSNGVEAMADGAVVTSALGTQTEWTTYSQTFEAGDTSTEIAFKDVGSADSLGTLLDNAVLCLVQLPDDGDDEEVPSCELTASDTSFRRGGDTTLSWNILNLMTEGVDAVITNSVDDEEVDVATETGSQEEENIDEDTTYTLTVYGNYLYNKKIRSLRSEEEMEREVLATCSVDIDTTSGGGGSRPRGDVEGDSTSRPEGQVLGEQVSVVPMGAADAGAGSTSPVALPNFGLVAAAFLGRSRNNA